MLATRSRRVVPAVAGGGGPIVTVADARNHDTTDLAEYTISIAINGAAAARKFVIAISCAGGGGSPVGQTVTIDGQTCTFAIQQFTGDGTACELWYYDDASTISGTVDVVVTWSPAVDTCGVAVVSLTGAASGGPSDTLASTAFPGTGTIDVAAGGAIVAATSSVGQTNVSYGATLDTLDFNETIGTSEWHSMAHEDFASADTGHTITATYTGGGVRVLVVAAWDEI